MANRDRDTAIGGANGRFPSTHVSLIDALSSGLDDTALERVAAVYWKPIYRFLRWKFHYDNEDAKDLTQGFFASAIQRGLFSRFDMSEGSFRSYIRMAAERHAATDHESRSRLKRGGGTHSVPVDESIAVAGSPDELFEREWARQILTLAIDDLRNRCALDGKERALAVFEARDLADEPASYAALAQTHAVPVTTITNDLAWARRALRACAMERLRGVTATDREWRMEARRLWT